jgi:hypothetical protein
MKAMNTTTEQLKRTQKWRPPWFRDASRRASSTHPYDAPSNNVQTAVGVVLLSTAAAAVFWKVKPLGWQGELDLLVDRTGFASEPGRKQ